MIIKEKFFHKGTEIKGLAGKMFFPSNEKALTCYTECLEDQITLALDPIHDYVRQIDELTRNKNQTVSDMIMVIYALENNARMILDKWREDLEKHIGWVGVRRVSHMSIGDLAPETAVGVDFIPLGLEGIEEENHASE